MCGPHDLSIYLRGAKFDEVGTKYVWGHWILKGGDESGDGEWMSMALYG